MTNKFHRMAALLFAAVLVWSVFAPAAFAADADECPDGGEHIWMDDDIIWSADNMTVTFTFECISCGQRVERTVSTTSEITKWPTCTEPGTKDCFASVQLGDTEATAEKHNIPMQPTGHWWALVNDEDPVWADDDSTVTCRFFCRWDHSHTAEQTADVVREVQDPACTEDGIVILSALVEQGGTTAAVTKTEPGEPALGHDWSETGVCLRCGAYAPSSSEPEDTPTPEVSPTPEPETSPTPEPEETPTPEPEASPTPAPAAPQQPSGPRAPRTGDEEEPLLWLAAFLVCSGALAVLAGRRREQ